MRRPTSCSTLNVLTKNAMAQTWHQGVPTQLVEVEIKLEIQ